MKTDLFSCSQVSRLRTECDCVKIGISASLLEIWEFTTDEVCYACFPFYRRHIFLNWDSSELSGSAFASNLLQHVMGISPFGHLIEAVADPNSVNHGLALHPDLLLATRHHFASAHPLPSLNHAVSQEYCNEHQPEPQPEA